jgi:hypothetical protein
MSSLKGEFLGEGRADERNCHKQGGKLIHGVSLLKFEIVMEYSAFKVWMSR